MTTNPNINGGVRPLSSLELTPSIRSAAETAFKNDAKIKDDKPELDPMSQLSVNTGTAYVDGDGKLRHAGTIFDMGNVFGHREKHIKGLIRDNYDALKTSYDKGTDSYGALSWVDRHLFKVTDDDISKGLALHAAGARENSPLYQKAYGNLTSEQKENINSLTSIDDIQRMADTNVDIKDLRKQILDMDKGPAALATLEGDITPEKLRGLITKLRPQQTSEIRAGQQHDASIAASNEQVAASQAATKLAALTERNRNAISQAEIQYKNDALQYDYNTNKAKMQFDYDSANFDRELKRDLAVLGLEGESEERRYNRERDRAQDKQLMIMQLMKGLGNLGQSMAL